MRSVCEPFRLFLEHAYRTDCQTSRTVVKRALTLLITTAYFFARPTQKVVACETTVVPLRSLVVTEKLPESMFAVERNLRLVS